VEALFKQHNNITKKDRNLIQSIKADPINNPINNVQCNDVTDHVPINKLLFVSKPNFYAFWVATLTALNSHSGATPERWKYGVTITHYPFPHLK